MNKSNTPKRIMYYDLLKLIAAFMVVFYHLGTLNFGQIGEGIYIPNINRIIMNFCQISVPIFFMVNGAILLNLNIDTKKIWTKSVKLIVIYIIWSNIIGGIINILDMNYNEINIKNIIKCFVYNDYRLWFLRTLSILYLLYPCIKWMYNNKNLIYLKLLLISLFIFPFTYNYVILLFKVLDIKIYNLNNLPRTGLMTMYSILYFILGALLSKYKNIIKCNKLKNNTIPVYVIIAGLLLSTIEGIILTSINGVVFDGVNSSFPTIGALLMSVGVFYIASNITILHEYINKLIWFIGENSIGIYVFHMPLVFLVKKVFKIQSQILPMSIITAIIIVVLSSILNNLIKRIPIIRWTLST